jgi:hypothetical protein
MPDERNARERDWNELERSTLYLLTGVGQPPVMAVEDIGHQLEYFDPDSIVRPLCGVGLLHRIAEQFVVATPAAYRWVQIVGHVD